LPPAEIEPPAPEIRELAKETPSSANDADSPLHDVRLTGVVIGPDLRRAIFAVTGTNSRVLSEGERLKGWRLESISPKVVMLSGPAGKIVLKPQPDANLVRPPPPVAVQS
jgi:type II secretory pathway component PulC